MGSRVGIWNGDEAWEPDVVLYFDNENGRPLVFKGVMAFLADEARHLADLNRARAVRLSVPAAGLWNIARTWARAVRLTVHD